MIRRIYEDLLKSYGPQGWYPLVELNNKKEMNITKSGSVKGYHPGDYSYPRTNNQRFEVCIGTIATQNTSWMQVEKVLLNLKALNALNATRMDKLPMQKLKVVLKPAGYFNQKAKKIKEFTKFYLSLNGRIPTREELLGIWGIGPETADSILLYAFKVPTFVVDAYTRRIFSHLGIIDKKAKYDDIKQLFEKNLQPSDLVTYQEYHSLIVEHAKRYYSKKDKYQNCTLYQKYIKKEPITNY